VHRRNALAFSEYAIAYLLKTGTLCPEIPTAASTLGVVLVYFRYMSSGTLTVLPPEISRAFTEASGVYSLRWGGIRP
jgi:hypothetical protein